MRVKVVPVWLGGFALVAVLLAFLAAALGVGLADLVSLQMDAGRLLADLAASLARTGAAVGVAWLAGIAGGYVLHARPLARRLALPLVNFLRSVSPFAWLPFAVVWFGLGEAPVAFVLVIALVFPALVAAADAFANLEREYVDEAQVLGAGRWRMLHDVKLPLAAPALLSLLRVLWGLGWSTVVAAEMLGVDSGLGFRLLDFRYLVQYPPMLVYVAVMGTVGIVVDLGLRSWCGRVDRAR
jgi:NitT/TauT family transport system permease protein